MVGNTEVADPREGTGSSMFSASDRRQWDNGCACVLSHSSRVRLFATLWTVARQGPLSMGFSRQEYWSKLPYFPPGDLPDLRMEPASPASPALEGRFFTAQAPVKPSGSMIHFIFYVR